MSQENLEVLWRSLDAFNQGDVEAFAALMTADAEIVPLRAALEGTVYRGEDAASRFWSEALDSWSDLHVDVERVHELGDQAVVVGLLRGRSRETGMELDTHAAWVFGFREGKVARLRTYPTKEEALEAVGLSE